MSSFNETFSGELKIEIRPERDFQRMAITSLADPIHKIGFVADITREGIIETITAASIAGPFPVCARVIERSGDEIWRNISLKDFQRIKDIYKEGKGCNQIAGLIWFLSLMTRHDIAKLTLGLQSSLRQREPREKIINGTKSDIETTLTGTADEGRQIELAVSILVTHREDGLEEKESRIVNIEGHTFSPDVLNSVLGADPKDAYQLLREQQNANRDTVTIMAMLRFFRMSAGAILAKPGVAITRDTDAEVRASAQADYERIAKAISAKTHPMIHCGAFKGVRANS